MTNQLEDDWGGRPNICRYISWIDNCQWRIFVNSTNISTNIETAVLSSGKTTEGAGQRRRLIEQQRQASRLLALLNNKTWTREASAIIISNSITNTRDNALVVEDKRLLACWQHNFLTVILILVVVRCSSSVSCTQAMMWVVSMLVVEPTNTFPC